MKISILIIILMMFTASHSFVLCGKKTAPQSGEEDTYGYPIQTVSYPEIRQLLEKREYVKLNNLLESCQKEFEKSFRYEYKLYNAYDAFSIPIPSYQPYFDEWVQKFPGNYHPYLARAFFYSKLGWESRGYKWSKDTSEQQFSNMKQYFSQAKQDVNKVFSLKPHFFTCYPLLINMNMTVSMDRENQNLVEESLSYYPYSFLIRVYYLKNLQPRWGGSYKQMDDFASDAQKYVKNNPRLRVLRGFSFADEADYIAYRNNNDSEKAIELYQKALTFGEYAGFYYGVAVNFSNLKKYPEALQAVNKALALAPQTIDYLTLRGKIHYRLGNLQNAIQDIQTAVNIEPNFSITEDTRLWFAKNLVAEGFKQYQSKNYDVSIQTYSWAVAFKSDHIEGYYWRGISYCSLQKLDLALADFKQCIQLDPHYFSAYYSLDWVLAHYQQWDTIIAFWTKYIELEPKDGRAYRERGGAYYHQGDLKAAVADAKKAADLGDEEGQKQYERLKGLVQ